MKKHLFIFLLFPIPIVPVLAQTETISLSPSQQFGNSVLTNFWENPAYTGAEQRHNINLHYRARWLGINGWKKYLVSYDVGLGKKKRLGLGIYLSNFVTGPAMKSLLYFPLRGTTTRDILNLSASYKLIIEEKHNIHFGLSIAYMQTMIYWSKYNGIYWSNLTFGDQIHERYGLIYGTNEQRSTDVRGNIDFGSGIWYDTDDFYFGLSILHITQPTEGFIQEDLGRLPSEYYITGGYKIKVNDNMNITPSFLYKKSRYFGAISPSIIITYKNNYLIGLTYKDLNTLSINAGVLFLKHLRFTIALGVTTQGNLYQYSPIGYSEFGLRYQFGKGGKNE